MKRCPNSCQNDSIWHLKSLSRSLEVFTVSSESRNHRKIYSSMEIFYFYALMFFWCGWRRTSLERRTKEFVIHVGYSALWHWLPDTPTYHSTRTFTRGAGIRFKSNYTSEFRYKVRFMVHILKSVLFGRLIG